MKTYAWRKSSWVNDIVSLWFYTMALFIRYAISFSRRLFSLLIRDRRQIMAYLADWLVDSYVIWNLIDLFKNVANCILEETKNVKSTF